MPDGRAKAHDIAFAIRDLVDAHDISHSVRNADGEYEETPAAFTIADVDISDPERPIVRLHNGQEFTVYIHPGRT